MKGETSKTEEKFEV